MPALVTTAATLNAIEESTMNLNSVSARSSIGSNKSNNNFSSSNDDTDMMDHQSTTITIKPPSEAKLKKSIQGGLKARRKVCNKRKNKSTASLYDKETLLEAIYKLKQSVIHIEQDKLKMQTLLQRKDTELKKAYEIIDNMVHTKLSSFGNYVQSVKVKTDNYKANELMREQIHAMKIQLDKRDKQLRDVILGKNTDRILNELSKEKMKYELSATTIKDSLTKSEAEYTRNVNKAERLQNLMSRFESSGNGNHKTLTEHMDELVAENTDLRTNIKELNEYLIEERQKKRQQSSQQLNESGQPGQMKHYTAQYHYNDNNPKQSQRVGNSKRGTKARRTKNGGKQTSMIYNNNNINNMNYNMKNDMPIRTFSVEDQNKAASKIQAHYRGRLARKEINEKRDAAIKIQSQVRKKQAYRHLPVDKRIVCNRVYKSTLM